jgi:hypothetical protein
LQQPCPLCGEVLFDSIQQLTVVGCGHAMHRDCCRDLLRAAIPACPLCLRTQEDGINTKHVVEAAIEVFEKAQRENGSPISFTQAEASGSACTSFERSAVGDESVFPGGQRLFCVFCRKRSRTEEHALGVKCVDCGSFCN